MAGKKKEGKNNFYSVKTSDNVTLWIKRYKPKKKDKVSNIPVILCHGLLANKHSLDFGEEGSDDWNNYSLAAFLYQGGKNDDVKFDVWVPELRGRRSYSEYDLDKRSDDAQLKHWCVDDYVDKDVPAIIGCIQDEYKSTTPVFWIGMSMGGMLGYAYGETENGFRDFRGVVTIGSPVSFENNKSWIFKVGKVIAPRNFFLNINLRTLLENNPKLKEIFIEKGANGDNIEKNLIEKYIELGFDNSLSSKVLSHFGVFFRHKNFCRYPKCPWVYDLLDKIPVIKRCVGPYSWKENLDRFKSPLLAIAGGADEEAPPEDVKHTISHVGSKDVTYMEFSKDSPYTDIDYGHLDFHLGKKVRKEFYPQIYQWLKEKTAIDGNI